MKPRRAEETPSELGSSLLAPAPLGLGLPHGHMPMCARWEAAGLWTKLGRGVGGAPEGTVQQVTQHPWGPGGLRPWWLPPGCAWAIATCTRRKNALCAEVTVRTTAQGQTGSLGWPASWQGGRGEGVTPAWATPLPGGCVVWASGGHRQGGVSGHPLLSAQTSELHRPLPGSQAEGAFMTGNYPGLWERPAHGSVSS